MATFYVMVIFIFYSLFIIIPFSGSSHMTKEESNYCSRAGESEDLDDDCSSLSQTRRLLFYDVNPPEGFNLRRDVFMRVAILTKRLRKYGDWILVLPPWDGLYHWKSLDVGEQTHLPWRMFFDLESIRKFVPVIDLDEVIKDEENQVMDEVYYLQHYQDAWENKDWEDKMDIEPCRVKLPYWLIKEKGLYQGNFWGYGDVMSAKRVRCLSFQGSASYIIPLLIGGTKVSSGKKARWINKPNENSARRVMIEKAEILLHDSFGNPEYWRARRSMRFASALVAEAHAFRKQYLNSSDEQDDTSRPDDWTKEKSRVSDDNILERGGPYVCVHLRRQDFLWGRSSEVPSLKWAAQQVAIHLKNQKLGTVFIATDAPAREIEEFHQHLGPSYNVLQWQPTKKMKMLYKDGGIAIIEQIICSHARFFIGTHESTFTFRIQEEREIIGFHSDTTFNRLCGGDGPEKNVSDKKSQLSCERPSRWKIVF